MEEKLQKIYNDKQFLHGNNVYNLDIERTQRYAIVHNMESNPILFGISDTGIKLRAPVENCEAMGPPVKAYPLTPDQCDPPEQQEKKPKAPTTKKPKK